MIIASKFKPELCASKDSMRYTLCDCYLSGTFLIATDGRRIVQIPVTREEGDVDGYIPQAVLQAARTQANKKRKKKFHPSDMTIAAKEKTLGFNSQFAALLSQAGH